MEPHLPILMYHDLSEERSPISTPPATFARQMQWLHEAGYQALPVGAVVDALHAGAELPARSIVLTFDDGFESVYTHAAPLLAEYGFSATVFLVSEYVGRHNEWPSQPASIPGRRLMRWSQIRELSALNVEWGAHTATHPMLDQLAPSACVDELTTSKRELEDRLGTSVSLFSYPYGRFTDSVEECVRDLYAGACTTRLGLVTADSNIYRLPRIEARYTEPMVLFRTVSTPFFPAYLSLLSPLRATVHAVRPHPWQ